MMTVDFANTLFDFYNGSEFSCSFARCFIVLITCSPMSLASDFLKINYYHFYCIYHK